MNANQKETIVTTTQRVETPKAHTTVHAIADMTDIMVLIVLVCLPTSPKLPL